MARDLVPLLSYLLLWGKCRRCHATISVRYPLVELGGLLTFLLGYWLHPSDPLLGLFTAFSVYFLFLIAVFDAEHQLIPDVLTILLALSGGTLSLLTGSIVSGVIGACIALVWFGGQWVMTKGRAIGTGDIFLGSALGLLLGIAGTVSMIILSYIVGAFIVLVLIGIGKISAKQSTIAFGPFMAIAGVLSLLGVGDMYWKMVFGA
jgi:prepilin signal peptidase PulO-like enzyme (type II secretory pathway)